jgi:hypothetical protein
MALLIQDVERLLDLARVLIEDHECTAADILPVIRLHPGDSLSVGEALTYICEVVHRAVEAQLPLDPPF